MSNRDTLAAAIEALASDVLKEELAERFTIWHEDPDLHEDGETFDIVDAFIDVSDCGEFTHLCNRILIAAGYYVPVSTEQLANTVTSRGAKAYDLNHRGRKYRCAGPMVTWLDEQNQNGSIGVDC